MPGQIYPALGDPRRCFCRVGLRLVASASLVSRQTGEVPSST